MKITASFVPAFLKKPDKDIKHINVFLLYGKNQGAILRTKQLLKKRFLGKIFDPLQFCHLQATELLQSPWLLEQEAKTQSMFGDIKIIHIEGANGLWEAIKTYLKNPMPTTKIIITTNMLRPSHSLRANLEKHKNAVALPFFEETKQTIEVFIKETLTKENIKIDQSTLSYLSSLMGDDAELNRQELEKLVVYVGPKNNISQKQKHKDKNHAPYWMTKEDISLVLQSATSASLNHFIDAVMGGNKTEAMSIFTKLLGEGHQAQTLLISLMRHIQALHLAQNFITQGQPLARALQSAFRPPLHFKREYNVKKQLNIWGARQCEQALLLLSQTERKARQESHSAKTFISHSFLRITQGASRLARRT